MNSNDNLFDDIEEDNNPSFYGNHSVADSSRQDFVGGDKQQNNIVNSSLGLSNKIHQLINDPKLKIDVVSSERLMNTSIIVYAIQLMGLDDKSVIVRRRYSEFKSLRDNLSNLFPTIVIPPIPEKHSIFSYLVNSINNSNEVSIVESRKRYFQIFLDDLIFNLDEKIKNCVLLHKFLDPNYESHWDNALNEPPVNLIPNHLLLANPLDPTDQNGLYSLLPLVNGFEFNSGTDNLSSLKKLSEELIVLNKEIEMFESNGQDSTTTRKQSELFDKVPKELINFEFNFNKIIKTLHDLNKLNSRSVKDYKSVINTLVELGGNLNYFSLQIYESGLNESSIEIEKFGSTIDSNFLNYESFLVNGFIPDWQEPIHQLVQYYIASLQLFKFYKYKIVQFKLLHKHKFSKYKELSHFNSRFESHLKLGDISHLNVNSPSISKAIKNMERDRSKRTKGLSKKASWYGLFGGSKQSQLPIDTRQVSSTDNPEDLNTQFKSKIDNLEKELNKLDKLIELANNDLKNLSQELTDNFNKFLLKIETKWIAIMLEFIKNGKTLFKENLNNWKEFREIIITD